MLKSFLQKVYLSGTVKVPETKQYCVMALSALPFALSKHWISFKGRSLPTTLLSAILYDCQRCQKHHEPEGSVHLLKDIFTDNMRTFPKKLLAASKTVAMKRTALVNLRIIGRV